MSVKACFMIWCSTSHFNSAYPSSSSASPKPLWVGLNLRCCPHHPHHPHCHHHYCHPPSHRVLSPWATMNALTRKLVLIESQGNNNPAAKNWPPDSITMKEAAAMESDGRSQTHADKNWMDLDDKAQQNQTIQQDFSCCFPIEAELKYQPCSSVLPCAPSHPPPHVEFPIPFKLSIVAPWYTNWC